MNNVKIFFIIIVIGALSFPFWLTPESASLKNIDVTDIGQLLGTLFVIALFLERALDVFLTTWRAEHSEELDQSIQECQHKISEFKVQSEDYRNANKAELDNLIKKLKETKQEKLTHSSNTRIIAMWIGLFFGVLISAVGVRTLGTLTNPATLPLKQKSLFNFIDVLLTGGLIAGGSDSIHKLTELYRNFVETTSKKAKKAEG
ncbi:MAG: hypothetical protein JSW07_21250 [bacterium]|nr:MAG: hypothetical protein JSW07_21250 [bacterium]